MKILLKLTTPAIGKEPTNIELPPVTVILPVYNAESRIVDKITNILSLDYPQDRIEIIVISDGSTDSTVVKARRTFGNQIRVIEQKKNRGKSAAQNVGFGAATHSLLLLTDVDAILDVQALRRLIAYFGDPSIGCVGANVIYHMEGWEASGSHGIYWRMEEMLRTVESKLGVLISVCGSGFAVRKETLTMLDLDTGDDFIIPLDLALRGYKTVFAHDAIVYDHWPSQTFMGELRTRKRITLRNFLALMRRRRAINPFKFPLLSFSLISHKLLRWLSPVFMAVMLVVGMVLAGYSKFYGVVFTLQAALYAFAILGLLISVTGRNLLVLSQLGSFLWSNIGMLLGLCSLMLGRRIKAYDSKA